MIYVIDGYNVMHAQEPSGIAAADLEAKRQELIEAVVNTAATSGDQAIIVFDAAQASSSDCYQLPHTSVTVCFASASQSADILIGKIVERELGRSGAEIKVVSADWEVQVGVMKERVERIPPRNFLAHIRNFDKKLAKSAKMGRMRWKLEHKVDLETLRKLEEMRRGRD